MAQMTYDDAQTQYTRLRAATLSDAIQTLAIVYFPPAVVLNEHLIPAEIDILLEGETWGDLHELRTIDNVTEFIEDHMAATTIYSQASTLITATGNSGSLNVSGKKELAIDINITSKQGTSPTIQFSLDRIGADNVAYNLWTSSTYSTTPQKVSKDVGAGLSSQTLGANVQLSWTIGGTSTPGWAYSLSMIAK